MAAIEDCLTPTLGGHVEQRSDCGLIRCPHNSCLMGKFSNGELRAPLRSLMLLLDSFGLHCRCPRSKAIREVVGLFATAFRLR
jgi:hypothetical protein